MNRGWTATRKFALSTMKSSAMHRLRFALRPAYLLIAVITLAVQVVLISIGAFDLLYHWSRDHESWELDELFTTFSVLSFALMAVLILRNHDFRKLERDRERAEGRAQALARFDALTGLPNRASLLSETCERISGLSAGGGRRLAVMILDIDHFKAVNDKLGHAGGDLLLQEVANRLRQVSDPATFVARIGGDEFAAISPTFTEDQDMLRVTRRLLSAVSRPFFVGGMKLEVPASMGIAVFPTDGIDGEDLIMRADTTLYQAKAAGRHGYAVFDASLDRASRERQVMETDLRDGIARGEIQCLFQPIFDLATRRPVGAEALARWQRPGHGLLPPGKFIGVAEDAGLIGAVFEQVLRIAAREAVHWAWDTRVAVNLSPLQLCDPGTAERIFAILGETGLPPSRLDIEITESALLAEDASARIVLDRLQAAGIHLSLDDFGTGYANLRQLRDLAFEKVKIDRSYIEKLGADNVDCLVERIIDLGHALQLVVVAEGLETVQEATWARDHRCDLGQGYYFSKPISADAVRSLLVPPSMARKALP